MKLAVTPDTNGIISFSGRIIGHPLPSGTVVVDAPDDLDLAPCTAARVVDGRVEIVANFIGSGPWYDQRATLAERETPHEITDYGVVPPNDLGQAVTMGWADMAMMPRSLTAKEQAARDKADEAARTAADEQALADRRATMTTTINRFSVKCARAGLISEAEAEAWVVSKTLPAPLAALINALPEAARFEARQMARESIFARLNGFVVQFGAALGKSDAEIDALFE